MEKRSLWKRYTDALARDFRLEKKGEDPKRKRVKLRYDQYAYYCPYCKGLREGSKKFNWGWFLFWTIITGGIGLFIYLLDYSFKSKTNCHTCNAKIANWKGVGLYEKKDKK